MNLPQHVRLVEVGPRDGLQNEKQPISVADKVRLTNDLSAAGLGYIDDVIMPHGTRRRLIKALRTLKNEVQDNPWKKHDNIPL